MTIPGIREGRGVVKKVLQAYGLACVIMCTLVAAASWLSGVQKARRGVESWAAFLFPPMGMWIDSHDPGPDVSALDLPPGEVAAAYVTWRASVGAKWEGTSPDVEVLAYKDNLGRLARVREELAFQRDLLDALATEIHEEAEASPIGPIDLSHKRDSFESEIRSLDALKARIAGYLAEAAGRLK